MRICTLLPSATEVCFALGLGDSVCGVTHECDFPAQAREKRVVVTRGFLTLMIAPKLIALSLNSRHAAKASIAWTRTPFAKLIRI